ncbi:MAG: DUF3037 domain-containing protein [Myxococcaceae bacterium]
MPTRSSFDYAVIRVVPRVDRGEFINAGIVVYCLAKDFLVARIELDEDRLRALAPDVEVSTVRDHLCAFERVCRGGPEGGPIGRLSQKERFHWLVAPRSTIIQVSPVHSGLTEAPETALENLMDRMVRPPRPV